MTRRAVLLYRLRVRLMILLPLPLVAAATVPFAALVDAASVAVIVHVEAVAM